MNKSALDRLNSKIAKKSTFVKDLKEGIGKVIVGQSQRGYWKSYCWSRGTYR